MGLRAPTFAVLRITKLKSWDAVNASEKRQGAQLLVGVDGLALLEAVRSLIGNQKVRTNAVLAV